MTTEQLKEKYGDEMVLCLPAETITCNGDGPFYWDDDIEFCVKENGIAKYRWEVENDPSFKQLVVYAVIRHKTNTFTTHRLAGDGRLTGKYSIGTGGHVASDESFTEALFRELKEEVGISPDDMDFISRVGYILDNSSDVNSVHLGVVYEIGVTDPSKVAVQETDKLTGEWANEDDLAKLFHSDSLESWSEIVYRQMG